MLGRDEGARPRWLNKSKACRQKPRIEGLAAAVSFRGAHGLVQPLTITGVDVRRSPFVDRAVYPLYEFPGIAADFQTPCSSAFLIVGPISLSVLDECFQLLPGQRLLGVQCHLLSA